MSRARRAAPVLVLAVAVVAVLGASPAAHAATASGSFDEPAQDGTKVTSNQVTFSGHFAVAGGVVDGITVAVTSPDGFPGGSQTLAGQGQSAQTFFASFRLPYNGTYTASAAATYEAVPGDGTGKHTTTVTRTFFVSVPPQAPQGLAARFDASTRTVALTWKPNPEPDIYGYAVQRQDPGAKGFTTVDTVPPSTSYTDKTVAWAPTGQYRYQLVTARPSGDGGPPVLSPASPPATVGVSGTPITTAPPPTTTPAGSTGATPKGSRPGSASHPATSAVPPTASAGDFAGLLAQARAVTARSRPAPPPTEPDPGYDPRLPFKPHTTGSLVDVPGTAGAAGGPALGAGDDNGRRLTLEYLAGALVLFVLALHARYLKRQADRGDPLEPLPPRTDPR